MRVQRRKRYAVLTGDVVGSTRLDAAVRRHLPRELRRIGTTIRREYPDVCPLDLSTYRGDSWQLLVTDPSLALEIAVSFRAALRWRMQVKDVDTRVAIGIGGIDFVPGDRISEGDGAALQLSGRALDELDDAIRMSILVQDRDLPVVEIAVSLLDTIVASWSIGQCQAVVGALGGKTQDAIASAWRPRAISQQAVGQHLDRARWNLVQVALEAIGREVSR